MTKDTKSVETLHVIERHKDGSMKLHELELYKSEDGKRYFRTAQPSERKMTNREWLSTLSDEDFALVMLKKEAELHLENFNPDLDIFDIAIGELIDFKAWLGEEHEGEDHE